MLKFPWLEPYFKQIETAMTQGRLSNSLIIVGRQGAGVNFLALEVAKRYLCAEPTVSGACDHCSSCLNIEESHCHADLKIACASSSEKDVAQDNDFTSNIAALTALTHEKAGCSLRIATMRKIPDFLAESSLYDHGKVVIIRDAETMSENAANSILKTFEEPHSNTLVIMVTRSLDALLPTIRSRAVKIHVDSFNLDKIKDFALRQENRHLWFEQAKKSYGQNNYAYSKMQSSSRTLHQESYQNKDITLDILNAALAVVGPSPLEAIDLIKNGDLDKIIIFIQQFRNLLEGKITVFDLYFFQILRDLPSQTLYNCLYELLLEVMKLKVGCDMAALPLVHITQSYSLQSLNMRRISEALESLRSFVGGFSDLPPRAPASQFRSWLNLLMLDNTFMSDVVRYRRF